MRARFQFPQYPGLSVEASYRFDERLAILGCFGEPTSAQYFVAMEEARAFDEETRKRGMEKLEKWNGNRGIKP
jgi:hypothetical protein